MNTVAKSAALGGEIGDLLQQVHQKMGEYDQMVMMAHREGFNEACDRLGAPPSDTPMERIALAGGNV